MTQACVQIVSTQAKADAGRTGKDPLQCLGLYLDLLKHLLLSGAAPIGRVPIAVILKQTTLSAGNAPVRNLMQGTGKIVLRKHNAVPGPRFAHGLVQRLRSVTLQASLVTKGKKLIKNTNHRAYLMAARMIIKI